MSYDNHPKTDWGNTIGSTAGDTASAEKTYPDDHFEILSIRQDKAAGPFHVNHYVAFFQMPNTWDHGTETSKLLQNFGSYFDNDITFSRTMSKTWKDNKVVGFNVVVPDSFMGTVATLMAHTDYVSLEKWTKDQPFGGPCVCGTTLRQKSSEGYLERSLEYGMDLASGIDTDYHFLSGRRSWKFGVVNDDFLLSPRLCYVETAALERFSLPKYSAVDTGRNPPMLRTIVNQTWVSMLKKIGVLLDVNFLDMTGQYQIDKTDDNGEPDSRKHFAVEKYDADRRRIRSDLASNVYFRQSSFAANVDLENVDTDWFIHVQERHPCLYPDNMP